MLPGLVSITLRQLTPQQIVELCHKNQLQVIEWGGDVHVLHDDSTRPCKSDYYRASMSLMWLRMVPITALNPLRQAAHRALAAPL